MDVKVYKTDNKAFPWRAEDAEGHYIDGRTKESAMNALRTMFHLMPKVSENQSITIPNEVHL